MLRLLTFLSLICAHSIFSQESIEWGQLVKSKGQVNKILPYSGSTFYTVRFQGGQFLGSNYFNYQTNFQSHKMGKIKSVVNNSTANLQFVFMINGSPCAILTDKVENRQLLYAQKYDSSCLAVEDPIKLSEYTTEKSTWKSRGYYNFLFSQNNDFFCVEYDIPGSKDENERFGYRIFTKDFEVVQQGEYELPYLKNEAIVSSRYLSNTGDYFISVKVYETEEKKRLFKDNTTLSKIVLMHVTSSGLDEYELNLEGKRVTEMSISSDNNRILTFSGLYGTKEKGNNEGVKGIFYYRLDFDNRKELDFGFQDFQKDFITQGWSDREIDRAQKLEDKGKGAPQLFDYEIKALNTLPDGSMVGLLEQYYMNTVTYTDPRGYSRTTYYYHYNDIIAYKINPNGDFEWVKKIPKTQITANDYGYFSSISNYINEKHLVIFFNDNLKNYSENGKWNQNTYEASFTKKTNAVAKVEVDLTNGEINRSVFINVKESKAIAIPKMFAIDYAKRELILYLIYGKKEKFGLIHF